LGGRGLLPFIDWLPIFRSLLTVEHALGGNPIAGVLVAEPVVVEVGDWWLVATFAAAVGTKLPIYIFVPPWVKVSAALNETVELVVYVVSYTETLAVVLTHSVGFAGCEVLKVARVSVNWRDGPCWLVHDVNSCSGR
jgi:hypothetical protein